jgi:hypothetical protein
MRVIARFNGHQLHNLLPHLHAQRLTGSSVRGNRLLRKTAGLRLERRADHG